MKIQRLLFILLLLIISAPWVSYANEKLSDSQFLPTQETENIRLGRAEFSASGTYIMGIAFEEHVVCLYQQTEIDADYEWVSTIPITNEIQDAVINETTQEIIVGTDQGDLVIFSLVDFSQQETIAVYPETILDISLSDDDRYLVSSGFDQPVSTGLGQTTSIWDWGTKEIVTTLPMAGETTHFYPQESLIIIEDRIWDTTTLTVQQSLVHYGLLSQGIIYYLSGSDRSPDGRFFVHGLNNILSSPVWDLEKDEVIASLRQEGIGAVDFSPQGKYLVTYAVWSGIVWAYDENGNFTEYARLNAEIDILFGNEYRHTSAKFSPDGSQILISGDITLLWDVQTQEITQILPACEVE